MTVSHMTSLLEEFEDYFGDPRDPAAQLSFQRILELDEREDYPYELVNTLQAWGVHRYCLPSRWGGLAGDVEVGFNLLRMVARRDLTTATALILTNMAFMPVWIAGTDEQLESFVQAIDHGTKLSWGLSESAHGSDVLANEMRAEKTTGGYVLTGEKDLIGNAASSDVVMVHARTNEHGGPGGWSLFALEKRQCLAGSVVELPDQRLHGLRGLDLSGVRLDGVFVPESRRIGAEGSGLEIALQSTQVARTAISSLALGATDTALRVTMDFAQQREIFGQRVIDIPYSRRQLAECFADMILAEAVSIEAIRGLQVNPAQASVLSSVAKYFVPTWLERTMAQLSVVLGARVYLRDDPHYGVYQKMLRDIPVTITVDGNPVVNLKNIVLQLDGLLAGGRAAAETREQAGERVENLFNLDQKLPMWQPHRQNLFSRGRDDAVVAFTDGIERLRGLARNCESPAQQQWFMRAAEVADDVAGRLESLHERMRMQKECYGQSAMTSAEAFRVAEQYCTIHAAAAVVHLTTCSSGVLPGWFPDGAVLLLCMERVLRCFTDAGAVSDPEVVGQAVDRLQRLHAEERLFSCWEFGLASATQRN